MRTGLATVGRPALDRLRQQGVRDVDAIEPLIDRLPNARAAGFEQVLGIGACGVDFAVTYDPSDPGLLDAVACDELPAECSWFAPALPDVLDAATGPTWFEFDTSGGPCLASLFVSPLDADIGPLLDRTTELLGRPPLTRRGRAVFDLVPPQGRVYQVGWMPDRPGTELRVCVDGLDGDGVLGFLADAGWEGDAGALASTIDELAPFVDGIGAGFDLCEGRVAERLGIEYTFDGPKEVVPVERWVKLLDRLVALDLATPAEAERLVDWIGPLGGPDNHPLGSVGVLNPLVQPSVDCGLHHVKTLHLGDRRLAKVYFGFAVVIRTVVTR